MRVAVVGSYGVGLTMNVPRVPAAGETLTGGTFALGPGGKGSNQAVAAARLGAEVSLLTAVGPDSFAEQARQLWSAEGVRHNRVATASASTMVGFIVVEPTGENRIMIAPGALEELTPEHVAGFSDELAAADIAVVSLEIPLDTALAALRVAHEAGTQTLLNPAPARPLPGEAWQWIDVVTPNLSEARVLAGLEAGAEASPEDLAAHLRGRSSGAIVLTLGAAGALVDDGRTRMRVPPVRPRQVVDTTGAGDSFTAALAAALGCGEPLEAAARRAAAAGAWTVGTPEVIPALPWPADIESLLREDPA